MAPLETMGFPAGVAQKGEAKKDAATAKADTFPSRRGNLATLGKASG